VQALALTFDDGPDEVWTPRLLELLARAGARATFFPIATRAQAHHELIGQMLADGHTVGLHCDEHIRHTERDLGWGQQDTARALDTLEKLGVRARLWRTPWGKTASWTEQVSAEFGLRLVGWSVDTHDWRGDRAPAMFAATRAGLQPGAVVLAHDGLGPGARRPDSAETLAFVELVIGHAERSELTLDALR
jgi:peptidoglycan/xylan/chitin deacetylase (PgdA/CDA1 family)